MEDKSIQFCPNCDWHQEEENIYTLNKAIKCPECESWCFEIYQYETHQKGKLVCKEAGITDNDGNQWHGETLEEIKTIFDKGFEIMKFKK